MAMLVSFTDRGQELRVVSDSSLDAVTSSTYGGLRGDKGRCLAIYLHRRGKPHQIVARIELSAGEVKQLLRSLIRTQYPSDIDRVVEPAKRNRKRPILPKGWR